MIVSVMSEVPIISITGNKIAIAGNLKICNYSVVPVDQSNFKYDPVDLSSHV
ncbi:MAG: hypothetical protein LBT09_08610 [Planctomycetaceae bacterium]|jgi:hypothetical protein|nr:hypothetical protein [Planctomycetaceae bacterium]